jgi:hypothetical protein
MLRPGAISGNSAMICAAWPEEQHTAPTPPSSVAMRSCSTATVGLVSRE